MPNKEQSAEQTAEAARERVERMAHRYVARGPYCLNPDPTTVEYVLSGLARNLLQHGRAYCPCREVTGDPERDRPNICPCPQHRADIARDGFCECGIFVSREYAAAHASDSSAQTTKEA
jgi:ferredoxin-thioredoxin reductase catalytic chain